jgi:uncharacterized protein (TIGR03437 family)
MGFVLLVSAARAQAPAVNPGGVVNDGSFAAQGVAPGSIVAIFGTNLASSLAITDTIPLSTKLGSVTSITFDNLPAPLYFVGPQQVNAQLPYASLGTNTSATVNIVVTTSTGTSAAQTVNVVPSLPGIFTVSQNGLGQAIATDNNTGMIAAPPNSIAGLHTQPISISSGHALVIWCTGLGPVTPSIADGANSINPDGSVTLRRTVNQPTVTVGGVPVKEVLFSGLAPQFVGENQVDVLLGANTPTGNAVPVQIMINGITTSDKVTIAVTN